MSRRLLAVALHDVEPRWSERVREVRAWLGERGVERVTLLAIPAPGAERRPLPTQDPALAAWLAVRVAAGDAVVQHGLAHVAQRSAAWPRATLARWQGGDAAEFPGLTPAETVARVHAGRAILRGCCGVEPRGFVAPGYAYTTTLRAELRRTFDWSADLLGVTTASGRIHAPALTLGTSSAAKRRLSPLAIRAGAQLVGDVLRLDVHPADFDRPGHVAALEAVLDAAAADRDPVAYDELAA